MMMSAEMFSTWVCVYSTKRSEGEGAKMAGPCRLAVSMKMARVSETKLPNNNIKRGRLTNMLFHRALVGLAISFIDILIHNG